MLSHRENFHVNYCRDNTFLFQCAIKFYLNWNIESFRVCRNTEYLNDQITIAEGLCNDDKDTCKRGSVFSTFRIVLLK